MRFRKYSKPFIRGCFGDLIFLRKEKYDPLKDTATYPCIELENIEQETCLLNGYFNSKNQKSIKTKFQSGDVLFGKLRPYLRKYALVDFNGVCSTEIWALYSNKLLNSYLFYYIQTEQFLEVANTSSGTKMPRAEWNLISLKEFRYPQSREEMGYVSHFLSKIDQRIETQSKIISNLESLIKGIRQRIFSTLNFDVRNSKEYELGSFLSEYSKKNIKNNLILVSVGKYGIRRRDEIYSKELSDDYSKNKVIEKDSLIIGMGSTQIDIGILSKDEKYCVSPAYTTYKISGINSDYLREYLIHLNSLLSKRYMVIGARQGKSVNKNELMQHVLLVHNIEKQLKVVDIFNVFYEKLQKEKDILSLYKKQKAYLLANMFI